MASMAQNMSYATRRVDTAKVSGSSARRSVRSFKRSIDGQRLSQSVLAAKASPSNMAAMAIAEPPATPVNTTKREKVCGQVLMLMADL